MTISGSAKTVDAAGVTSAIVGLIIGAEELVRDQAVPRLGTHQPWFSIGLVLGSSLIAGLIYSPVLTAYRTTIWRFRNRRMYLAGDWELELRDKAGQPYRKGKATLHQEADAINLSGLNSDFKTGENISRWRADATWIESTSFTFLYQIDQSTGPAKRKTGLMIVNLDGKAPPRELVGNWYDIYPGQRKGGVTWRRIS